MVSPSPISSSHDKNSVAGKHHFMAANVSNSNIFCGQSLNSTAAAAAAIMHKLHGLFCSLIKCKCVSIPSFIQVSTCYSRPWGKRLCCNICKEGKIPSWRKWCKCWGILAWAKKKKNKYCIFRNIQHTGLQSAPPVKGLFPNLCHILETKGSEVSPSARLLTTFAVTLELVCNMAAMLAALAILVCLQNP